jgi:hypothetical protein
MLEVGSEAMLNSLTKSSRIMSLRHVIVTFGTCLNCQSLSAVKDMHTSISVVVRQAGVPVSENSADANISSAKPRVALPSLPPLLTLSPSAPSALSGSR